ncbi:MAG TPA: hypothetical protein VMF32_13180 [Xanthobacteraceae bacterium]|nr:hypothetical protein [Xanthobacteraceae bacterium]
MDKARHGIIDQTNGRQDQEHRRKAKKEAAHRLSVNLKKIAATGGRPGDVADWRCDVPAVCTALAAFLE